MKNDNDCFGHTFHIIFPSFAQEETQTQYMTKANRTATVSLCVNPEWCSSSLLYSTGSQEREYYIGHDWNLTKTMTQHVNWLLTKLLTPSVKVVTVKARLSFESFSLISFLIVLVNSNATASDQQDQD
jgi:hypothetical protein